jgi:hypothetical protein
VRGERPRSRRSLRIAEITTAQATHPASPNAEVRPATTTGTGPLIRGRSAGSYGRGPTTAVRSWGHGRPATAGPPLVRAPPGDPRRRGAVAAAPAALAAGAVAGRFSAQMRARPRPSARRAGGRPPASRRDAARGARPGAGGGPHRPADAPKPGRRPRLARRGARPSRVVLDAELRGREPVRAARARIALLAGSLSAEPLPAGRTRLRARLPLQAEAAPTGSVARTTVRPPFESSSS